MHRIWITALAFAILIPTSSTAESDLAAAAKKEKERREKNQEQGIKPVRKITQEDVKTVDDEKPPAASGTNASSASDSVPPATSQSSPASEADNSKEQEWRARATAAHARVEAARKKLAETPEVVTERTDFRPAPIALTPNPAYKDAEQELKAAEQALVDLEDEARRAGALPGRLR